jgi:hypothetical protein
MELDGHDGDCNSRIGMPCSCGARIEAMPLRRSPLDEGLAQQQSNHDAFVKSMREGTEKATRTMVAAHIMGGLCAHYGNANIGVLVSESVAAADKLIAWLEKPKP